MSFTFNIAKGMVNYYAGLPAASDRLVAVLIEATGLEAEATMKDYDNLSTLLAGSSNEQTTGGRKTLANVTVTVDDTNDRKVADCDDIVWSSLTGNAVGAIVVCYDASGADTDTQLIPLTKHDWALTPDGSTATATVADFFRATD